MKTQIVVPFAPRAPKRAYPNRHLIAVLYRKDCYVRPRRYASLRTGLPSIVGWLLTDGRVSDTIELYHEQTGLTVATVRLSAIGRLIIKIVPWEE